MIQANGLALLKKWQGTSHALTFILLVLFVFFFILLFFYLLISEFDFFFIVKWYALEDTCVLFLKRAMQTLNSMFKATFFWLQITS